MMKSSTHYILAAGIVLYGCFAMTGFGERATAETISTDALSEALGVDVSQFLCRGSRKFENDNSPAQKLANASQISTSNIGTQSTDGVENETKATKSLNDENAGSMASMDHSHIPVAVPKGAPAPKLSVSLTRDVMSGYNLVIKTENFEMTAPPIGVAMEDLMAPRTNAETGLVQGHAHLYINGEKIQRVYGNSLHLPASHFKDGMNQLNITINNHAHMFWTYDEKQIISSMFVNTAMPKLIVHQFDSFPMRPE